MLCIYPVECRVELGPAVLASILVLDHHWIIMPFLHGLLLLYSLRARNNSASCSRSRVGLRDLPVAIVTLSDPWVLWELFMSILICEKPSVSLLENER